MNIKNELDKFDLNTDNAVVIGSGILNALNIRESKDIDVVVSLDKYLELKVDGSFEQKENHGKEILTHNLLEIGESWTVLGKMWNFNDLLENSIVIDNVRYITMQFLLSVKQKWLAEGDTRQKSIDDVRLMQDYLKNIEN
jgi:hypothetical protein